jgi:tetratricopeptide (TPR) repeat protein
MNSSRNTTIWVLGAMLALLTTGWLIYRTFDQQQSYEQADISIEMGIALFQEKKYTEAMAVFEGVPSGSPRQWRALYYQGSAHIMLKDYQSAVVYLEQALALNPSDIQIMNALGVAYFKLGNLKLSKAYFASILEIEPDNMEAKGLMDIMANLERQQPNQAEPDG